ncbi:multidrug resistance-associated protein 1-like [Oppia nitens]|uniref:multidrug resistance-associated protein 1-like n=1 Tax=Oppia nitens TaxID=1686743 RepID=UPI0023DB2EEC|nr:multidrug resistance-associated protein 1-like [Oppia nitens]
MFELICNSSLWDSNQTWNTESPKLSSCMIQTVFVWLPAFILWLCIPYLIWDCIKSQKKSIQWNYYNISRLLIAIVCTGVTLVDCILCLCRRYQWDDNPTTAHILATIIQFITRLALCIVFYCHRKYGINSSGCVWLYLLLDTVFGALSVATYATQQDIRRNYEFILYCIEFSLTVVLLVFCLFADRLLTLNIDHKITDNNNICPENRASFASKLTFHWLNKTLTQQTIGQRIRSCLTSAVYRKSLVVDNNDNNGNNDSQVTNGEIISLMAIDCSRFADDLPLVIYAFMAPIQIAVILYQFYVDLGLSSLSGLVIIVLLFLMCAIVSKYAKHFIGKQMSIKDQRLNITNDILNGMKVTKLYAWEEAFHKIIVNLRINEIKQLRWSTLLNVSYFVTASCAPYWIIFFTFMVYLLTNVDANQLNAQKLFVPLALAQFLRGVLVMFPQGVNSFIWIMIAIKRLEKYLNLNDKCEYIKQNDGNSDADHQCMVSVTNGRFTWETTPSSSSPALVAKNIEPITNSATFSLNNINLKIHEKQFVAVVGSVGSGKSSLLAALFGEMKLQSGTVSYGRGKGSNKIAYVPQQAWIQNASLKDNILFGKPLDTGLYKRVVRGCALEQDLRQLSAGDQTEIGEKGINLSGGQKQRVSLARAVYSDADLYLLDDPLSAVDSHVGKHLMQEVLDSRTGILKNKTRILVTNQLFVLPNVDLIVVLNDGNITAIGSYDYLMNENKEFYDLVKQYSVNNENNDNVYLKYAKQMSIMLSTLTIVFLIISAAVTIGINFWLKTWSQQQQHSTTGVHHTNGYYLAILAALTSGQILTLFVGRFALVFGSLLASTRMHDRLLWSVMRSPMKFFDTTPLGRIVNRFSKDIDTIDTVTAFTLGYVLYLSLVCLSGIIVVSIPVPLFMIPVVVLIILESITRSPIIAYFSETLNGLPSIRAYGCSDRFIGHMESLVDTNQRCQYPSVVVNSWLQIRLDCLSSALIFFVALLIILKRQSLTGGDTGMALSNVTNLSYNLGLIVRMFTQFENSMVSFERIDEYCRLESEADLTSGQQLPDNWPTNGCVEFRQYSTRYREGLDLVLNQIDLNIKSGEKIGIVGRTGAGKSSLTLALFRLIESVSGKIVIDGIDISQLGLQQLRSRLTILPQDPVLYTGTIRSNLDPFDKCSDDDLWSVLEHSHLKSFVKSSDAGLDYRVTEGGDNLSVGQRQLICLARTLLRNTRVLILDEATAAVDVETDALIQQTIRQHFKSCTVLTIAHRLNTIMDSDRVLVLNEGRVAEFDSPNNLLNNETTIFYSLAKDAAII